MPRALKKMLGGGVMEESCTGHCSDSVDMRGWSFGLVLDGWRRERELTLVIEGCESSVERI